MDSEYTIPGNLEGSSAQASFAWKETGICFAGGSFRALCGLGSKVAKDYLKKFFRAENYGIQILYATKETKNGRDHSALLGLLDSLVTKSRKSVGLAMITQNREKRELPKNKKWLCIDTLGI